MAKGSPETLAVQDLIRRWSENPQDAKPALATQTRLAEWWGLQDLQMSRSGQVPDELGGVSSTSAVSGHPSAPIESRQKMNAPEASGSGLVDLKEPAVYNWIAEADWAGCQPGRPEVFIYTITMR
ncbi:hypothetical protein IV102_22060 [bacterium]|nr:hypothetical protein [bacterium]